MPSFSRTRSPSRLLRTLGAAVAGTIVVTCAVLWGLRQHARIRLESELERLRAEGEPIDSFGTAPLRSRFADDVLTVWSIGFDLEDDGGTPNGSDAARRDSGDIVVRVRVE